mmetsp:Transcript_10784/g.12368  ORF Transcript_10784/g.12368 Transcript_10784/m.12368 type:complete len:455 (+) Transcript_10784:191-1555(+)|eukprot:CAMPEP_0204828978 /NCGR_PEP_ID=MMETSP1346-20131115/6954_1 /ASSEMBLY_ACC=CAM_ASM_000771 /TAXON_ID=215587 /ORGANISM="Aplanochytrium stocchinoi, Strain GSBS06" /LENGTH=454 /DNA_ID=CAMNT_0051958415 /DNA_START=137 /DNA_END=1501 /DNA_ORIENTATION=-
MARKSKGSKESWQSDIAHEMARRRPRIVVNTNHRVGVTRTITQRLQDLRNRDRVRRINRKGIEECALQAEKAASLVAKSRRFPLSTSTLGGKEFPSLASLSARVFLLDIHLYTEYEEEFHEFAPPHIKELLLEEAAFLSRERYIKYHYLESVARVSIPIKRSIVDNSVLRFLLSKSFKHLNLSYSKVTDEIVMEALAPKLEYVSTSTFPKNASETTTHDKDVESEAENECEDYDAHVDDGDDGALNLWEMVADLEEVDGNGNGWRVKGLAELTSLDVSFCSELSDDFVRSAAEELPRLKKLNMSGNFVSDNTGHLALNALVQKSTDHPVFGALVELNLSYSDWLSPCLLEVSGVISKYETTLLPVLKLLLVKECIQLRSNEANPHPDAVLMRSNYNPNHSPCDTYQGFEEIGSLLWHFRCAVKSVKEWETNTKTFHDYYLINAIGSTRKLKIKV